MSTVTLSSKFQIVIPISIRKTMKLNSGIKIEIIPYENRIELIPLEPISNLRGALKGMSTSIIREKDRL